MPTSLRAFTGRFIHCLEDPQQHNEHATEVIDNGVLLVEDGHVVQLGQQSDVAIPVNAEHIDLTGKTIVPGFIDTHVHYPQTEMIASYGTQLLEWLNRYTFPAESRFAERDVADEAARFFLDELLRNGTTTALVFGTVHKASVDAFFTEAQSRQLRMLCGKVMMDRNAPSDLCDCPESSYQDSAELIKRWHNKDRLGYAVTPRFAPTSSEAQLQAAGQLLKDFPGVHMHTHLAENTNECDWVASLFPEQLDYLAVYERFGLVGKRSVFAHGIHLSNNAWRRLADANAAIAHCPTSNLFIGSGLFNMREAMHAKVAFGIGSDVGGGDSLNILRNLNEAYKIQQLQGFSLSPQHALYLATLGGARALDLDQHIGNFEVGKEADFVALDSTATPMLARRCANADWESTLFALMMLGDDRCIYDTFIMGESRKRTLLDSLQPEAWL